MTMLKMNKKLVSGILILSFINLWVNKIFQINLFISLLLLLLSFLLFFALSAKYSKYAQILTIIVLLSLSSSLLINHLDQRIFTRSIIDSISINQRHEYYAKELGKIYRNRVGLYYFSQLRPGFTKLNQNLADLIDFSQYFNNYSVLFLPFFIVGFFYDLLKSLKFPLVYLICVLFTSMFIKSGDRFNILLLFPFINLCVFLGLVKFLPWIQKAK